MSVTRLASFLLLAVLVAGCRTPTGSAGSGASPRRTEISDPGKVFRVMTYNIHAGKDAGGVDNLDRVASLIRDEFVDIALLQEVDVNTKRSGNVDQPRRLAEATGRRMIFGRTLNYDGGEYGIMVLSRWPLTGTLVPLKVQPPQQRAGGSYEPRGALVVRIDAPGGALHVVNTHLDASGDDRYRRQEIRAVAAIVDSLRALPKARILVGGDFNSEPASAVQATAREARLRDAWLVCGKGTGLSYPAKGPTKRIDYLYLTGNFGCRNGRVLESQASDHRAVLFEALP